jgi:hypothetical protein
LWPKNKNHLNSIQQQMLQFHWQFSARFLVTHTLSGKRNKAHTMCPNVSETKLNDCPPFSDISQDRSIVRTIAL